MKSWLVFTFLFVASGAFASEDTWMGEDAVLEYRHFEKGLKLLERDPETKALLVKAYRRVGVRDGAEFFSKGYFRLCDPDEEPRGGRTKMEKFRIGRQSSTLEQLQAARLDGFEPEKTYADAIREFKSEPGFVKFLGIVVNPGYVELKGLFEERHPNYPQFKIYPSICLDRYVLQRNLRDTFVHEFTHWVYLDPARDEGLLDFPNRETYFMHRVQLIGDEVDAYVAELRAVIRAAKSRNYLRTEYRGRFYHYFNDDGDLIVDREKMARAILEHSENSANSTNPLSSFYEEALVSALQESKGAVRFFKALDQIHKNKLERLLWTRKQKAMTSKQKPGEVTELERSLQRASPHLRTQIEYYQSRIERLEKILEGEKFISSPMPLEDDEEDSGESR